MDKPGQLKRILWNEFYLKWGKEYEEFKSILKLLNLYPERLELINIGQLIPHDELENYQIEWLWICSRMNDLDKNFFQPNLVPINQDEYNRFVDISDPLYPISSPYYTSCSWENANLFDNIIELIEFLDSERPVSQFH